MVDAAGKTGRLESKEDINLELKRLEERISELRVQYEQYFAGVLPLAPDRLHAEVKRTLRLLLKAPFRTSAFNYRLKALKNRYSTFDTYWQRVLKERDAGTYSKDVFKATMRERFALEDAHAQTNLGIAERNIENLFRAYKNAIEKQSGRVANLDFGSFRDNLVKRASDLRQAQAGKKLCFKIVVKDGKVTVQARLKD